SPLLDDVSISGATSVLLNFTGSSNLTLYEVNEAAQMVAEETAEDENVIFGLVIDESMGDAVRVTVIATGFQDVRQATGNNRGLSVVDADKRIRKVVNESFHAAPMGRNNGRPTPMGSGFDTLRAEDYDIPTFFRSKD
ncbi:MAG TPA: cell division protein FtsZ, partial [Myxococcota bacterium]|nr:cell division protein FtsZ [Myxococcota bacterium]